jgi:hypothetical protein
MPAIVNFLTPSPGPNIIEIIDTGGDNEINVLEIFSEWKDWLLANHSARAGLPQAFTVIGGEDKSPTTQLGQAFFLHPEWKIRPAERDHRVVLVGDIQVLGGVGSVFVPTVGAFTVLAEARTSTLITGLSGISTSAEIADAVWDEILSAHLTVGSAGRALTKLFRILGLDPALALHVLKNGTRRHVGAAGSPDIDQTITEDATEVVVTTTTP